MNRTTKLKKAVKAVRYEIDMFNNTAESLANPRLNQFHINVLLESFVIHTYCLFRFFYQGEVETKNKNKRVRHSSDIIAEDFGIRRGEFRKNRTPKKDLKNIEEKRNKQLAHLTYNRVYRNIKTKGWHIKLIHKRMNKTIAAFFNSLPNEYKDLFK